MSLVNMFGNKIPAAGGASFPPQAASLQIWYDFVGDVATNNGVLGAPNDGTIVGSPSFENSPYGRAIILNPVGATQYITVPAFGFTSESYTIASIYKTSVTTPGSIVRGAGDSSVLMSSWTSAGGTSGKTIASTTSNIANFGAESVITTTDGVYHLAIGTYTYNSTGLNTLNMDGGSVINSSTTYTAVGPDAAWRIGMFATALVEPFNGRVAQHMIWDVILTETEKSEVATHFGF